MILLQDFNFSLLIQSEEEEEEEMISFTTGITVGDNI
jgi:hypothetical protein